MVKSICYGKSLYCVYVSMQNVVITIEIWHHADTTRGGKRADKHDPAPPLVLRKM